MIVRSGQTYLVISNLLQNNKISISLWRAELCCLFVASRYLSMEASVLSCHFIWVWSCMSKVLWYNKSSISLERLSDFVGFLHVVICIFLDNHWSYKNMLFWVGIVRHRLSANHNVRCFKKLENSMMYQVDFLLLLKLWKICYFGLWPQKSLDQSVCRMFYFWLNWLVNLNAMGPLLHCNCFLLNMKLNFDYIASSYYFFI